MKVLAIIALLLFALIAIAFLGAIVAVALMARCDSCPYKDKCDENFECPYDHISFHDNNQINPGF